MGELNPKPKMIIDQGILIKRRLQSSPPYLITTHSWALTSPIALSMMIL